jgi:hypothetical protein
MELLSKERRTKMQVIDRRGIPLTTTFGDLAIGEAFQDNDGDMCIKTDIGAYMYYDHYEWIPKYDLDADELIIPLEITYTIEREGSRK